MDYPFKSPAVISFCPGILGLERGLARAGVDCRVAAYVEIESFIVANLIAGMEAGILYPAPVWTDATTFDAEPFSRRVHGFIGGYPCPGESLAGLREKHLYKGFIWPAIRRAINAAKPLWCFFENVDDHITGTFPIVHRSLRNMGYAVEAGIFSAEEAGFFQERKRLFILAVQENVLADSKREPNPRNLFQLQPAPRNIREEKAARPIDEERLSFHSNRLLAVRGQGIHQFPWEAPRTAQSGLGCTINGYNFREDLLRAFGNSVVEQTAELAFRELYKKHFNKVA